MPTPGRKYQASNRYRYGFNGKENDPETVGTGSGTQDYGMRIYNPSLGRFLSVDPIGYDYPWNSTYAFAENEPISNIDLDGLEKRKANICNINKCWNGRNNKPKSGHVSHFDLKTAVSKLNRKIHKLTRKEDIEKKQNSNLPNNKTKEAYKEQKEQKEKSPSEPQGNDNKPKERDGVVTVPDMFNSYATGDVYQDKNSVDFHSKVDEGNTLVKNVQKAIDNFKNPDDAEVNIVIGGDDVSEEVKQKRGDEIKKKLQDGGYKGTINVSTNGGNVPVQIMGVDGDADKKTENGTKIEN